MEELSHVEALKKSHEVLLKENTLLHAQKKQITEASSKAFEGFNRALASMDAKYARLLNKSIETIEIKFSAHPAKNEAIQSIQAEAGKL